MNISKLDLVNFRNFKEFSLTLPTGVTLIQGKNGAGKTSLLEAIYVSSKAHSFRAEDADMISHGAKNLLIGIEFQDRQIKKNTHVFLDNNKRKILKINTKKTPQQKFINELSVVLFTPTDVGLVGAAPNNRRKFLDNLAAVLDKDYYLALVNYRRVLHQRNHVLWKLKEGRADTVELEIWDIQLIKEGEKVLAGRMSLLEQINGLLSARYHDLVGDVTPLHLNYKSSFEPEEDLLASFYKSLFKSQEKDIKEALTHSGPHRDDFEFVLNGRSAPGLASRGEQRAMVLALKLVELDLIKLSSASEPVVLLDDVFSELDDDKKLYLSAVWKGYQTIITSAEPTISKLVGVAYTVDLSNNPTGVQRDSAHHNPAREITKFK